MSAPTGYQSPTYCLRCGVPLNRGNSLCSQHATAQLKAKPR